MSGLIGNRRYKSTSGKTASVRATDLVFRVSYIIIAGIVDIGQFEQRVPTVIFSKDGFSVDEIAQHLAKHDIFAWSGIYYALEVMKRLGREDSSMVRVGAVHYNTIEEIDELLNVIEMM